MGLDNPASMAIVAAYFNPPIPCGMGRRTRNLPHHDPEFQSTHPVWDGTGDIFSTHDVLVISIHPSRVGWDRRRRAYQQHQHPISIHPSRVGWDLIKGRDAYACNISIHPSRVGWDVWSRSARSCHTNFNPPIPCGMGPDTYSGNKPC